MAGVRAVGLITPGLCPPRAEGRLHTSFWWLPGTKDLGWMFFPTSEVHDEFHESEREFSLEGLLG